MQSLFQCQEAFSQNKITVNLGFQIQIEQFIETVNYITVFIHALYRKILHYTAQKMKFSIKDFFIFCAVLFNILLRSYLTIAMPIPNNPLTLSTLFSERIWGVTGWKERDISSYVHLLQKTASYLSFFLVGALLIW